MMKDNQLVLVQTTHSHYRNGISAINFFFNGIEVDLLWNWIYPFYVFFTSVFSWGWTLGLGFIVFLALGWFFSPYVLSILCCFLSGLICIYGDLWGLEPKNVGLSEVEKNSGDVMNKTMGEPATTIDLVTEG